MSEDKKVWITKYALTPTGIFPATVIKTIATRQGDMYFCQLPGYTETFKWNEVYRTKEVAIEKAKFMVLKAIERYENKIRKLEEIKF